MTQTIARLLERSWAEMIHEYRQSPASKYNYWK